MKQLKISSSSRSSITAKSTDEIKEYSYQMLYDEVQRKALEEKNKNKKKKMYVSNVDISKSQNYMARYNPENFNLMKKIKEIRKKTKEKELDPSKKDSTIAFAKDKVDIVFESTKLLKELQKRKNNSLNDDDSSLSAFLLESKEISIKNLLIKLLKYESNKLENKEKKTSRTLNEGLENFKNDQKAFMEYSEMQKKACKEIEKVLFEIQKKNKELSDIEKSSRIQCKSSMEEIEKTLEQIDNSRICAKFVNQVLGCDTSKFQKEILPDIQENQNSSATVNYDEITKTVIHDYNFCLTENFQEIPMLQDPNSMILKFTEFEDSILRLLQYKAKFEEEYEKVVEDDDAVLNELMSREEMHKSELAILSEEYDKLYGEWLKLENSHEIRDGDFILLIKDLHKTAMGDDYVTGTKNFKKKQLSDIVKEAINKLKDKEATINELIGQLEVYENNTNLFYQIVNARKNQNKENKQQIAKLKLEQIQNMKKKKAEERFNRIIVQSRKTEPPFHFVKKVKQVSIDTEEIERENDKDLINY